MATIATLIQKNDGFEGTLATLTVTAAIALIPNARKAERPARSFVIFRKNGFELGADRRNKKLRLGTLRSTEPRWPLRNSGRPMPMSLPV